MKLTSRSAGTADAWSDAARCCSARPDAASFATFSTNHGSVVCSATHPLRPASRNVVERAFAWAKQWRAIATRYDKLAITYRAAVLLAACITWSRK